MRNRAKCLKCLDIIESKYRHDFVWCSCRTVFVDGGNAYWRAGGDLKYFRRVWDDGRETSIVFEEKEEVVLENSYDI